MNDLIEIYRRIEYLRNNGLKMKEIADYVDMAPSVLSALYSSVLPTYVTSLKQGHSEEDSLDLALAQVNNVSKKRLLGNLASIKELLFSLEPAHGEAKTNLLSAAIHPSFPDHPPQQQHPITIKQPEDFRSSGCFHYYLIIF